MAHSVTLPITERGVMLVVVNVFMIALVVVFVAARMVRNVKLKKFGWDEVLILFATLLHFTTCSLNLASVSYGNGRHIYAFPNIRNSFYAIQLPWVSTSTSAATLMASKASLAATLVMLGLGKKFNAIIIGSSLVLLIATIWSIKQIVGCNPQTNPNAGPCGRSRESQGIAFFQCAANIFLDIVFFTAPEIFLRKTKLSARDRLAIRCLLAFVFTATIMSVLKVVYIKNLLDSGDVTWHSPPVSATAAAECACSIIAACLPAVRQLAGQRFPKRWAMWMTGSSRTSTNISNKFIQRNLPRKDDDIERCLSPAGYGPPYSIQDVKIMNDINYNVEDDEGIKLIPYNSKSPSATAAKKPQTQIKPSNSLSTSVADEELRYPSPVAHPYHTESLESRLSSRYREASARYPQTSPKIIIPDENEKQTTSSTSWHKNQSPDSVTMNITPQTETSMIEAPKSALSREPSRERPTAVVPITTNPKQSSSSTEKLATQTHRSTESVDAQSSEDSSLPTPPFYYENNKVRRSARPSLDSTPSSTWLREQSNPPNQTS